jgi:hypothetical protein
MELPIADCQLPITDCQLPIANYRLPIVTTLSYHFFKETAVTQHQLQIGNRQLAIGNVRMQFRFIPNDVLTARSFSGVSNSRDPFHSGVRQ